MKTKTETSEEIKQTVKEKYAQISEQSKYRNEASCCGSDCGCDTVDHTVFAEDYAGIEGYNKEADLGLSCGLPTEFADISKGDTVIDLGSGAGNDCFVARQVTGREGRVIGLDMTKKMNEKARKNAGKLGYENMEFIEGDIEDIPLGNNVADVVVSNCVLNLVPDKQQAFSETFRILKPGGHFSISDVVISGELPESVKEDAEMYVGCVSGAIDREEYLAIIEEAGFENVKVQKERDIRLPDNILTKYLTEKEIHEFKDGDNGIFSVTVYGKKAK